jgi:hypothetical protein
VRPGSIDATSAHRFGICSGNVTSELSNTLSSALLHGLLYGTGGACTGGTQDDDCPPTP